MAGVAKKRFSGAVWNVSDEEAKKQLKRFLTAGWVLAVIALFAFGILAYVSAAFSGRCIGLSWRKANSRSPKGVWLKVASVGLFLLSIAEIIALLSPKG